MGSLLSSMRQCIERRKLTTSPGERTVCTSLGTMFATIYALDRDSRGSTRAFDVARLTVLTLAYPASVRTALLTGTGTCNANTTYMATIRRSISIHAPADRVFEYVADPTHLPAVWPSLVQVRNVESHEAGKSFDWDYKLLGVRIHGHSDPVERVANERLVTRSVRGIPNTFRWLFSGHDGQTDVALEVDYQSPIPGKLAERLVGRANEREAETLLKNLKRTLEA